MARNGLKTVIYKGTFVSNQSLYVKFGKEMTDFLLLIVSQTLLSTLQVQAKLQKLAKKSVNKQNAGPQQFF